MYTPLQLAEILRDTMRSVEQGTDIAPDDPSLLELKRILLKKITTLEAEEMHASDAILLE